MSTSPDTPFYRVAATCRAVDTDALHCDLRHALFSRPAIFVWHDASFARRVLRADMFARHARHAGERYALIWSMRALMPPVPTQPLGVLPICHNRFDTADDDIFDTRVLYAVFAADARDTLMLDAVPVFADV